MKITIRAFVMIVVAIMTIIPSKTYAQISVPVEVEDSKPTSACISLEKGSTDMDVIVKFLFNEQKNTLTVSLASYRELFVFNDRVRYSKVFSRGKLKPGKLPYKVDVPEKGRFRATTSYRKSIRRSFGKCHRKYEFSNWMKPIGMQPIEREYALVNDCIEQTFDITQKNTLVSLYVNDISVMDPCRKEGRFKLIKNKNVNRLFEISIKRNPCFGRQEEIAAALESLNKVKAAYDSLKMVYGNGVASSEQVYNFFNNMKKNVTERFPKKEGKDVCPSINDSSDKYNAYLDSIASMQCLLPDTLKQQTKGIDVEMMLVRARKLDAAVGKWLNCKDLVERRDLENKCMELIEEAREEAFSKGVYTKEQHDACNVMHRAEIYYHTTCKK